MTFFAVEAPLRPQYKLHPYISYRSHCVHRFGPSRKLNFTARPEDDLAGHLTGLVLYLLAAGEAGEECATNPSIRPSL